MGIVIFLSIFFVFGFVIVFALNYDRIKKRKQQQANTTENNAYSSTNNKTTMTDEQRRRLEYLREQQKQRTATEKHERHVADAEEHGHSGEEEHYEEIVGSLGDVSDEGCEDLSGVRFIVHDLAYDTSDDDRDYTELARAIVLGDIINTPRFKGLKRL